VRSTAALLETGLDLRPRTLAAGVGVKVCDPSVKKGAIFRRDRDIFIRKRVPEGRDELETVTRAQLPSFFQQVRTHAKSIRPPAAGAA
jgi:hypothetical protein